jgi:hypothetical protein
MISPHRQTDRYLRFLIALLSMAVFSPQASQAVTLTQTSSTEWKASNGIISYSINPTNGTIFKLSTLINGVTTDWMNQSYPSPFGHAIELYNICGYSNNSGGGTNTANYHLNGGYLDLWITKAHAAGSDPLEIENHWVIRDTDPGIHFYQILRHVASDGATSFGAATTNFFPSANAISRADGSALLYQKDIGAQSMGVFNETSPSTSFTQSLLSSNAGRQVQAETVDYTATTLGTHLSSPGLAREFITKYDHSTYEQYHVAHGYVGSTNAFWWVVPSHETMNGGPTKQYLTGIQIEYESAHLGGQNVNFAAGQVANRMFGPFYLRFNAFDSTKTTADDLYNDAANSVESCLSFYDGEGVLVSNGYRARSNRGSVNATIANSKGWSATSSNNVFVLSDNNTYFQESAQGAQYWGYANAAGDAVIPNVLPGTYRLTAYCFGQWGLYHADNITVGTTTKTVTGLTFQPRNFSTQAPVWTIGTPDRTAHEFLHAHMAGGFDDREYLGRWNYWQDVSAGLGKFVYTIGTTPSYEMPFTQFNHFYPNLYAGVYGGSTSGINGYDYITPSYVISGAAAQGVTPANFSPPPWEVHFTTTAAQLAQGPYVLVSINLAANDTSSLQVRLNGKHKAALLWYPRLGSDPEQRSGVSGYNNYAVFQFNTADLNAAGTDNVLTLWASGSCMYDALKMEIGPNQADPVISGWPEYDWVYYGTGDNRTTQAAAAP